MKFAIWRPLGWVSNFGDNWCREAWKNIMATAGRLLKAFRSRGTTRDTLAIVGSTGVEICGVFGPVWFEEPSGSCRNEFFEIDDLSRNKGD